MPGRLARMPRSAASLDGGFAGDVAGAIDLLRDGLDLVAKRHLVGIEKLELGLAAVGELDDRAREIRRALAAARPMIGDDRLDAFLGAQFLEAAELGLGIGAEAVDRYHRPHTDTAQVF